MVSSQRSWRHMALLGSKELMSASVSSIALCMHFAFHKKLIIEPHSKSPFWSIEVCMQPSTSIQSDGVPVRMNGHLDWTWVNQSMEGHIWQRMSRKSKPVYEWHYNSWINHSHNHSRYCLHDIPEARFIVRVQTNISRVWILSLPFQNRSLLSLMGDSLSSGLYEAVIHPAIVKKYTISTLKKIGIAILAAVASNIVMLVASTIWYTLIHSGECMFTQHHTSQFSTSGLTWSSLTSVSAFLMGTGLFEFVCAQAPYSLRGMLVGLVFLAVLTSIPLGSGISALWMTVYNNKHDPNCNVWFYLFTTVTLALGSVVW